MATAWLWRWWLWWGWGCCCCCFLPLFLSVAAGQGSHPQDGLPRPWLTVDRSAKLLTLSCGPPPPRIASQWTEVHDLRLVAFLPAVSRVYSNTTVAVITSAMKTPRPGPDLPPVARVHFSGEWGDKTPLLQVTTPLTPRLYGTFYCVVAYSPRQGLSPAANFSTQVSVDAHGPRVSMDTHRPDPHGHALKHNFRVSVKDVHEVKVTWRDVTGSRFMEASLTRVTEDREGGAVTAPRTLLIATGGTAAAPSEKFVFGGSGVELSAFSAPRTNSDNYSMTAYVGADACSPYCSYACSVPYPGCVGPDHLHFCVYPPQQPPPLAPPPVARSGVGWMVAFIIFFVATLVLCVVVVWGVFRGKRLQKEVQRLGSSGQEVSPPDDVEGVCSGRPAGQPDRRAGGKADEVVKNESRLKVDEKAGGAADEAIHRRPVEADARSRCRDKDTNRTTGRPARAEANNGGGADPKRKQHDTPHRYSSKPMGYKDLPADDRDEEDESSTVGNRRERERDNTGASVGGKRMENGEGLEMAKRQNRDNLPDDDMLQEDDDNNFTFDDGLASEIDSQIAGGLTVNNESLNSRTGHRPSDSDSFNTTDNHRGAHNDSRVALPASFSGRAASANMGDAGSVDENCLPKHEEFQSLLGPR